MIKRMYRNVRQEMLPGDVIAFGGCGMFSRVVKFATNSNVSHVGIILQTKIPEDNTGRFFNQIIESTSLDGSNGVTISRFSERLRNYVGDVWWLPLTDSARKRFNQKLFFDFMLEQEGKPYDVPQAIKSALDSLDGIGLFYNKEDFSKLFCSELAAAGLEKSEVLPEINASEVTPIDLCEFLIFKKAVQLKGALDAIRRDPPMQIRFER